MPTLAAASLPPPAAPPPARPRWRALVGLTLVVALAHLLLLGLAPTAMGPDPSPLASRFSTRTIVIAPPAPPPAPPAAAAPAEARLAPPPKPRRPREASPPRPRPAVAPAPAPAPRVAEPPPSETSAPAVEAAIDPGATPAEQAASAPRGAATAAAAGAGNAAPSGDGASAAGANQGQVVGSESLRIPGSVKLAFAVTGQQGTSPMQGVFGDLVWLQDGSSYDARLSLKFLFRTIRSQHSIGRIGPTGIEPARFSESRKGEVASHFLRDQGQVMFSNNAPPVPLQPGAQDRLSVVMQLGGMLAGDPARYPPGSRIAVQTVGPRDAGVWVFVVEGEEQMSVPAGSYAVRKLTRSPRREGDDKIEIWLAPAFGYLPVRMKQTQPDGDFADMQLRESLPAGPAN
jgi:outer membrane biosynthesis protein TonB